MKTPIRILPLTVIAATFFFSSCSKDVITPTQAEQTAIELQDIIKTSQVDRVYAFDYPGGGWTSLPASAGHSWSFSHGYISIAGYTFNQGRNLAYLYTYNIANVPLDDGTTRKALLLYFK